MKNRPPLSPAASVTQWHSASFDQLHSVTLIWAIHVRWLPLKVKVSHMIRALWSGWWWIQSEATSPTAHNTERTEGGNMDASTSHCLLEDRPRKYSYEGHNPRPDLKMIHECWTFWKHNRWKWYSSELQSKTGLVNCATRVKTFFNLFLLLFLQPKYVCPTQSIKVDWLLKIHLCKHKNKWYRQIVNNYLLFSL